MQILVGEWGSQNSLKDQANDTMSWHNVGFLLEKIRGKKLKVCLILIGLTY